ncbi:MAG TPA: biotin/lipoyl-binding protein, partial [Pirellulales bacterium]|nr:biotin/lipoyl-binding protein [Pirellulales bacterium]
MKRLLNTFIILGFIYCASQPVSADDAKADKPAEATSNGKSNGNGQATATFTVEKKPMKIEVQVDGVFEATETREVAVKTDEWSQLTVEWAVDHGTRVKKGDPLLRFDTREFDIALADKEADLELAKLALQNAESALELKEKSVPESLAAARRAANESAENLARFRKSARADMIRDAEESLRSAERSLSYQLEELKQLERMYKADDLTEETEEIVLVRARHRVEAFEYNLEKAKKSKERFDSLGLPRLTADIEQAATNAKLALQQAEDTMPASLVEARLGLEKLQTNFRRSKEKLSRLRRDG